MRRSSVRFRQAALHPSGFVHQGGPAESFPGPSDHLPASFATRAPRRAEVSPGSVPLPTVTVSERFGISGGSGDGGGHGAVLGQGPAPDLADEAAGAHRHRPYGGPAVQRAGPAGPRPL